MRTLTKLLWILLLGVVFSCQDNVIDAIDATIDEKNFDTKMYETSVSVEDARNVAELFTVKDAPRTRVSKSVKEIITIEGEVNKPSMYIINYDNEQGFLLVSATKTSNLYWLMLREVVLMLIIECRMDFLIGWEI